jgi:flagellar motility protein MotE (MotC chaperone)
MNVPRLLPLIGVAVAGVIAVNALAGAHDLPQMLSAARAMAEGVAAPDKPARTAKGVKAGKPSAVDDIATASAPPGPSAVSPIPVGVCAPNAAELAKSAGLSPAELQMLQNLQNRRGQIDQREKDIDVQVQLLTAAETKLDAKLKAMNGLKSQIEALMGQADQKTQGEVDRLVVVYSKMKPQDAAAVMSQLDDKVRVPVAAAMKPAVLAAMLGKMDTLDAKKLTELLAHRFAPVQQLADAARAPPAAEPAAAPAPKAAAKPKAQADADANPDDANVEEPAPKKAKPVKIAKRAPPKKKPVVHAPKPKPAVVEAKAPTGLRSNSEAKDLPAKDTPAKPADPPAAAAAAAKAS